MKKKLISLLLACAMVLCLMPTAAMAADNGKAIQLGVSGIEGPSATTNGEGAYYTPSSYIYFGVNGNSSAPIKWRVLDADKANDNSTPGMFLLSEYLLESVDAFESAWNSDDGDGQINPNQWQHSDAQEWCIEFASATSNFSVTEQKAMLGVAKADSSEIQLYDINWNESSLTGSDKMFFLSARELSDYVGSYSYAPGLAAAFAASPSPSRWGLRSPDVDLADTAGIVDPSGRVSLNAVESNLAARPAFNLDPDSVLFTSAAVGGKSASGMDGGLTAVQAYSGNEWKLTLEDSARKNFNITTTDLTADSATINYKNAKTGTNEYISAIIEDENGAVTHYGRLKAVSSDEESGTVNINLSGIGMEGKTLYVFNEQYNGDQKTDYASPLWEVVPPTYTATVTPNGKDFNAQIVDYTAQEQQEFTITNTGNQALVNLKAELGGTNSDGFVLDEPNVTNLATNGSTTFTVKPKLGLGVGSYDATVTVSANNMTPITMGISFTVNDKETVSTPKIDPNGGIFHGSVEVRITCATSDARIYYTTDGSDPTASSAEYTGTPFTLTRDATVKAFAVKDGMKNSSITSAEFTKYVPTYYNISVSADPVEGGTVTGGDSYIENASVNVTATPKSGYRFVNWTENGSKVSTDATYSFTVTKSRNLVAVFEAVPSVPTGGVSSGIGSGYIAPAQNSAGNAKGDIRISGMNIPSGDALITTPTQNSVLLKLLGGNTLIGMWDIKLQSGRTSIPGSTLSFNVGRENAGKIFTLYHQKADGTTERFSATADAQGIVSFYPINELSPFMLVQGGGITTTSIVAVPATGDVNMGLGLLLLSATMAAVVLMMRRKA